MILTPDEYKCSACGVFRWGKNKQLLSLEMHHKDGNQRNSLLSNLELLCPNCHSFYTHQDQLLG